MTEEKKPKKRRRIKLFFIITLITFIAPFIAHASILAILNSGLHWEGSILGTQIYHKLRILEGWGIYYGQTLMNSVHGGLLYWIAFIMFIWGFWVHLYPSQGRGVVDADSYLSTFFIWIAYFGIIFFLLMQPWESSINPLRVTSTIADKFTDDVLVLFNGNGSATAAEVVNKQMNKMAIIQMANLDPLSPAIATQVSKFMTQCASKVKGTSDLGVYNIANSHTDSLYENIKYYKGGMIGSIVSCATVKQELRKEIAQNAKANLIAMARAKGITDTDDLLNRVEQQGKQIYENDIIKAYKQTLGNSAIASLGPPTTDEELAAYALENSNISSNVYKQIISNSVTGVGANQHVGVLGWLAHSIGGDLKMIVGGAVIILVQYITRALLPFLLQGLYIVNSVFYALVLMFMPLILVLAMGLVSNIRIITKYIFVVIWVKSWIIPISIIMNLYVNYLDKPFSILAPIVVSTLLLMTPSIMAIILLEGNAAISKLSTGVEGMESTALRMAGMFGIL